MTVSIRLVATEAPTTLPPSFSMTQRGIGAPEDPFLPPGFLRPTGTFHLAGTSREVGTRAVREQPLGEDELVILVLEDGSEFVTSAGRMAETLQRLHPDWLVDGALQLDKLSEAADTTAERGVAAVVGGLIKKVFTIRVADANDQILEDARRKLGVRAAELAVTRLGTKALMAAIESRLKPEAGLYAWTATTGTIGVLESPDPERLRQAAAQRKPMLVFVHGTGSNTFGSFHDLAAGDGVLWSDLRRHFSGGIYALEHRTFSESPIDNALALARVLPPGARLSFVSHSRGGLVVDLICAAEVESEIAAYTRAPNLPGIGVMDPDSERSRTIIADLDAAHEVHRKQLRQLAEVLRAKQFVVERYVRVASPAAGTKLASGNFDLFLSGLLNLVGLVPVLAGNPWYAALKRILVEIARNRTDPHLVPGIEAMLPDSPMASFLPRLRSHADVRMALIAGDIEGGSLLKRLGVFLTDTLLFDTEDNDLVVDTTSMLAGIAPAASARVMFDRGASVSHFRYFENLGTRSALRDWLVSDEPNALVAFRAMPASDEVSAALAAAARGIRGTEGATDLQRPVAVVLPGVMGSHLRSGAHGRVWFALPAIVRGKLADIAWDKPGIEADDLFEMFYGDFCKKLAETHRVERFAYDWRQPLDVLAERLGEFLDRLMQQTSQPVRLIAHSMGGLVVRACIHKRRPVIDAVMARDGARLVMLGTPNQGAHSMVANLIGKGDTLRTLVLMDQKHSMQEVLDMVGRFRGALQLLPRPDFVDMFQGQPDGGQRYDYWHEQTWHDLKPLVKDFWFGNGTVARLDQAVLDEASWLWKQDAKAESGTPSLPAEYAARSAYVFGVARNTPCGVRVGPDNDSLKLVGTPHGDGTVTWLSGRIGGFGKHYYLPAAHGDLLATPSTFDALIELIDTGDTGGLPTTPPAVRDVESPRPVMYDAAPPRNDATEPATLALLGGVLQRRVPPARLRRLEVRVCARDLRFVDLPIMVGHYEQDPIVAAERLIDEELLDHDLSARQRLGLYAGPIGTATVVLRTPNAAERGRGSLRGAVVTGLGALDGNLDLSRLTEAARIGALRYLLHVTDVLGTDREHHKLPLATLLLGFNSSASLSVSSSVEALVRGVIEANAQFAQTTRLDLHIARLEIVELYVDTAITAVYALRELQPRMAAAAAHLNTELVCAMELSHGEGARPRLFDATHDGYWPRLIVTSVDDWEAVLDTPTESSVRSTLRSAPVTRIADTLRYVYVGRRARAEALMLQRQPGLVEGLVERQVNNRVWDENFGRTLFQLMVPHAFKEAARQLRQAVIVVDRGTANLPWELMLAHDAGAPGQAREPMAIRTRFVRQLATDEFRQTVQQTASRTALVIGDPSTQGFGTVFIKADGTPMPELQSLEGARREVNAVAQRLRNQNYEVRVLSGGHDASTVMSALYEKAWRVLHISAHGVFGLQHIDKRSRSGVVLSDGLLLTAAEIGAMEQVPEVVVLNCCHLGNVDLGGNGNKLAASIATELISNGVRCVLVAGWAVNDELAMKFGDSFYEALLEKRLPFGEAVFTARRALWHENCHDITWGAFQAYGEPDWVAEPRLAQVAVPETNRFVSPDEFIDTLATLRTRAARRLVTGGEADREMLVRRLEVLLEHRCMPAWRRLAEVRSALGATWLELREFERAYQELLAAVRTEDRAGRVPLRDVERLANVEARLGEETGNLLLIQSAIQRLEDMQGMMASGVGQDAGDVRQHAERAALRGSAYKRMASVAARTLVKARRRGIKLAPDGLNTDLQQLMRQSLADSAEAYASAEEMLAPSGVSPYQTLNRLAIEALLASGASTLRPAVEIARACARQAEADFTKQRNFWNAVMVPEALLVERLLDRTLSRARATGDAVLDELRAAYNAALRDMPGTPAELDSVAKQMELLALFLLALSLDRKPGGSELRCARRLLELAHAIYPSNPQPDWLEENTATKADAEGQD